MSTGKKDGSKKPNNISKRGFGSMNDKQRRAIAAMGGKATSRKHGAGFFKKIGRTGGLQTSSTHGDDFYKKIGMQGGTARKKELGVKGYAALGRKGGRALWKSKKKKG